ARPQEPRAGERAEDEVAAHDYTWDDAVSCAKWRIRLVSPCRLQGDAMTVLRSLGLIVIVCLAPAMGSARQDTSTYAEQLGWPKGTRALILHVDDVGMSYD